MRRLIPFIFCSKVNMTTSSLISLFRASNFLEFMWPLFALSQPFGLLPYKISRGILSSSIPGYVYAASVMTLLTIAVSFIIYRINFYNDTNYESLPALLQADCYIIFGYIFTIASFIRNDHKLMLYKKMSKISCHVEKSKWNSSAIFIHAKDIIGFLLLVLQMPNAMKGNYYDLFVKIVCFYLTLVIYLLDNHFVNCVLATKLSFETINSELGILEDKVIAKEEFRSMRRLNRDEISSLNLLIDIRSVRKKYEDLCTVVKMTIDAFAFPIIVSVGLTFAEVTFSLYFYIIKSIGAKEINLEKQIWYFYFITSATYYSTKFLAAVWTCEATKDEAQKCKVIVHRILMRLYDREVIEELQSFSLQMVQRNISFSAHGISLDGSLVTGIVGGISTYILILIQFMTTKGDCDVKTYELR